MTPQWLYHLIGEKVPSSTGFVGFSAKQSDQSNFTGQIRNGDLSGSTQNPPKSQSWGPQNSNFTIVYDAHVGVSINGGTPKWMVYRIKENPIQMDDLEVPPPFYEISMYTYDILWQYSYRVDMTNLQLRGPRIVGNMIPRNRVWVVNSLLSDLPRLKNKRSWKLHAFSTVSIDTARELVKNPKAWGPGSLKFLFFNAGKFPPQ